MLVADDQELVRTGFCVILEAADGITVVAEAADGAQAVQAAADHQPDVILMDVRMPEIDGIEATRRITGGDRTARSKVVMLTTFDLDDYVYEALRAGASGFLLKDAPRHDLIAAVKIAAAGNALLAPSVTMRLRVLADVARTLGFWSSPPGTAGAQGSRLYPTAALYGPR